MSNAVLDRKLTEEEGVSRYLQDIQQYPRLSPEEERALAVRCASGDEDAIRILVNSNMWFVVHIANKYKDLGIPLMDLIQEGSIGLILAARKFDHTLGYRLSTYAGNWIRGAICRYLREHEGEFQLSSYTASQMNKLKKAKLELENQLGNTPTAEQLAEACGFSVKKTEELLDMIPDICSLDAVCKDMEDREAPQPQDALVRQELEKQMEMLLGKLTKRQQTVLKLRFGMEDGVCHTMDDIGKTLGITRQRVRQIEQQAMDKLQKLGAESGLEDFLE